jgi:hypothetical protein
VYRPDGTCSGWCRYRPASARSRSPHVQFVAIVVAKFGSPPDDVVNVYRVADGTLVGSHTFVADLL